ncbi:hypothetical protein PoB_007436800 [Plakobranchus ocellatus]|uniref:Spaetzle domain-containing protein n=1 Tax=Plakobranchus ocellatus TaxID=259542 RepID=A0AAV4DU42_9GAST|nr:hypothetical protein PoB_007436800 [Plakobranchus ocellatus]
MHRQYLLLLFAAISDSVLSLSYYSLPPSMRGAFRTEAELLNDTVLMAGGLTQSRQRTLWITHNNFLKNHRDVERTIQQFMMDNDIHGAGYTEYSSGRYVDGCCPQLAFFSAIEMLTNIEGVRKYLVHFDKETPPKYQYVPFALCTGKELYCNHGHCFQGTTIINLLAYDNGKRTPISFDQFEVPTYCGCVQY